MRKILLILIAVFLITGAAEIQAQNMTAVVVGDTTVPTGDALIRVKADRDSLLNSLNALGVSYDLLHRNATTIPSLTGYKNVILLETSFITALNMGPAVRDSIKAFLGSGTAENKKNFLAIGGDFGYNYDRSAAATRDTILSRVWMGFNYVNDNGSVTTERKITGLVVNPGTSDSTISTTAAPYGNFYPDAMIAVNGALGLYSHTGRTVADSLVAIGLQGTTHNAAVLAVDPRYVLASALSPGGGNTRIIGGILEWLSITVIPVELTSFSATSNGNNVLLAWETATEINNSGFAIERSFNSSEFEQVAFVAGKGSTTETSIYSYSDKGLAVGTYTYRLRQVDFDGTFEIHNAVEVEVFAPAEFELAQNYPNPFNPSTSITYSIPVDGLVKLSVYNLLGEKVADLVNELAKAGTYEVKFDAINLTSGFYIYRLESGSNISVKKMMLMK